MLFKAHPNLSLALLFVSSLFASAQDPVEYNRDIRPILSDKCFFCHGPDEKSNKAGLRLDNSESALAALKESKSHAIVPGSTEKSALWQRVIATDPDEIMPPPESNLSLTSEDKQLLKTWIEQGAEYQPHWSFVPLPDQIPLPETKLTSWVKNPIDHFVAARLETESLAPSPEASPLRWFRRVSFDLTGLPPTPEQISQFQNDLKTTPETAHQLAVDRLLASFAFAEHTAIDWLDAARYADTWGYHSDMTFNAWPYRDWVVKSLHEDMPYDQFLTWNLAGDLLPNATSDQRLATMFSRLSRTTNEGGSNFQEFFIDGVSDRVNTVGTTFLGLTMECAKCHDHKYDPITQKDYFQLFAFFNSINETGVYNHGAISPPPSLLLPDEGQKKDFLARKENVKKAQTRLAEIRANSKPAFQIWHETLAPETTLIIADQTSHLDLEKDSENYLHSRIQPSTERIRIDPKTKEEKKLGPVRASYGPARGPGGKSDFVPGPPNHGTALKFNGDEGLIYNDFFQVERYHPFTIALWIKDKDRSAQASIIAQRTHGHDVGYNGIDLAIQDGYLTARVYRSWPDNGIGVRSKKRVPQDQWQHLTWTWDGSGTHQGFALYLNGTPLETTDLGHQLYKSVNVATYQTPGRFMIGAIFRGRGFQNGEVDEIKTFSRALVPAEVRQISDLEKITSAPEPELYAYYLENHHPEYRQALTALAAAYKAVVKREDSFLEVPVMEEMTEPRPAFLLNRGDFDKPTEQVKRDSPGFLLPFPKDAPRNRLGLAQWLIQPNHPLTSRVYVNRIWSQLFGRGLVSTNENFGLQGSLPTHPKLLDWLARDFIENKWSTKHLIRQIVLSATYRQNSALTPELQSRDPKNELLSRGPSHRLSGEQIRDAALLTSGLLDEKKSGPPSKPYDPLHNKNADSKQAHSRSLYSYWRRTRPQSNMTVFDKPSLEVCAVDRTVTSSPAQALALLNDIHFVEPARHLATLAMKSADDQETRLRFAWEKVTSHPLTDHQLSILKNIYQEQIEHFKTNPESAKKLLKTGFTPAPKNLDPTETAALTIVAQAIYSTDHAVWKR